MSLRRPAAWLLAVLLTAGAVAMAVGAVRDRNAEPEPVVSLTFDDGFATQWTARRILAEHGYRATFYINSARLGTPRRLNGAQVRLLADEGHEIGGHTLDHVDLPRQGRPARVREICDDRLALTRLLGADVVRSFAYPYGASDAAVERDVADCGYNSARIVGGLDPEVRGCRGCPHAESLEPDNPMRIRSSVSFVPSTPIAQAKRQILAARRGGGGWIPLVFHEVCDGCSGLAITPADFDALLDWMRANDVTVRTVDEVVGGGTRPVVPAGAVGLAGVVDAGDPLPARAVLLVVLAVLFGLPIGGLAVARAFGWWGGAAPRPARWGAAATSAESERAADATAAGHPLHGAVREHDPRADPVAAAWRAAQQPQRPVARPARPDEHRTGAGAPRRPTGGERPAVARRPAAAALHHPPHGDIDPGAAAPGRRGDADDPERRGPGGAPMARRPRAGGAGGGDERGPHAGVGRARRPGQPGEGDAGGPAVAGGAGGDHGARTVDGGRRDTVVPGPDRR